MLTPRICASGMAFLRRCRREAREFPKVVQPQHGAGQRAATSSSIGRGGSFMHSFVIHAAFDVLAWLSAALAAAWIVRGGRVSFPVPQPLRSSYLAALVVGAALGAILFGSANL